MSSKKCAFVNVECDKPYFGIPPDNLEGLGIDWMFRYCCLCLLGKILGCMLKGEEKEVQKR